jgi:hypothetical protein
MQKTTNHYLIRVGDSRHLWSSSLHNTWGIHSYTSGSKFFLKNVKPGDCLWFVKGKSGGLIVASAIFECSVKRINGNCLSFEDFGWVNVDRKWDTDIRFKNFKKIENMNLLSKIKGSSTNPRIYNQKCLVNLPEIYSHVYPGKLYQEETHDEENTSTITEQNIIVDGVNYLVTTNADIQDEKTQRFIDSLVSSEESDDEEENEELCDEKESLQRILFTCKIISNELENLTSLLNNRLDRLDRL